MNIKQKTIQAWKAYSNDRNTTTYGAWLFWYHADTLKRRSTRRLEKKLELSRVMQEWAQKDYQACSVFDRWETVERYVWQELALLFLLDRRAVRSKKTA